MSVPSSTQPNPTQLKFNFYYTTNIQFQIDTKDFTKLVTLFDICKAIFEKRANVVLTNWKHLEDGKQTSISMNINMNHSDYAQRLLPMFCNFVYSIFGSENIKIATYQ